MGRNRVTVLRDRETVSRRGLAVRRRVIAELRKTLAGTRTVFAAGREIIAVGRFASSHRRKPSKAGFDMSRNAKTDPRHDFLPARDSDLVSWSRNFRDQIVSDAPAFGLTQQQADDYSVLHDAFAAGYKAVTTPSLNTSVAVAAKNDAKKALKANARMLARIVQATPSVTDEQRRELGLTVADPHLTPVTRPSDPPLLYVMSSLGRTVRIRLKDKSSLDRAGRPLGTAGAVVMSYTSQPGERGANRTPANMANWTFRGIATRRTFDVNFDADVPAGAQVWIAAMWFNTRGELSAPSTAQSVRVGDGIAKPPMRLAA